MLTSHAGVTFACVPRIISTLVIVLRPNRVARFDRLTTRVHCAYGLSSVESARSSTAGKYTPAFRAPLDEENSVTTGTVGEAGRTLIVKAVSTMARSVRESSRTDKVPLAVFREAAPP